MIFYAVEQLKTLQMEEAELASSTTVPTTSPHAPGQHQPVQVGTEESAMVMQSEKPVNKPTVEAVIAETEEPKENESTTLEDQKPELSEETPEAVYGTPETNHETPEASQEIQEVNPVTQAQEKPAESSGDGLKKSTTGKPSSEESSEESEESDKRKKEASIDSVVQEIYGIVKPQNKTEGSSEEDDSKESKSDEDSDEEYDENRSVSGFISLDIWIFYGFPLFIVWINFSKDFGVLSRIFYSPQVIFLIHNNFSGILAFSFCMLHTETWVSSWTILGIEFLLWYFLDSRENFRWGS